METLNFKMMKNTKKEIYSSKIIENLFNSISPEESEKIEKRMLLASKIDDGIKAKGWKKKDLLTALGKQNPSIITKWLSGIHNFTTDTLIDLERVLDIELLNLDKRQETQVGMQFHIKLTQEVVAVKADVFLKEIYEEDFYPSFSSGSILTSQPAEA
jgi:ribosome-binding protein aMBF1 (putative translation factor)